MNGLLVSTWPLLRALGRLERALCVVLIAGIVLSIVVQVITRYVFGQPLVWVEELAGYCFIWSMFLGAAAGFKELRHIRIETFLNRLSPRRRDAGRALVYLVCTGVALLTAWYAFGVMGIESRSTTMALPIDLPRHYFYSVPLTVCMLSIAATGLHLVASYLQAALTGAPVPAEADVALRQQQDASLLGH